MKKLLLITIMLLLQSFPSFGECRKVISDIEGVYFIEKDTIRKNGNLIYFNYLTDYYEPTTIDNSLSSIHRTVINCSSNELKNLRVIYYLDSMGRGEKVPPFEVYKGWFKIERNNDSVYDIFIKYLCR